MHKSQATREQAIEVGLSFQEEEQRLNAELFLNKYPRWEMEAPIGLLCSMRCFCMPLSEGGRRWRGLFDEATSAACQGLSQRQTYPS